MLIPSAINITGSHSDIEGLYSRNVTTTPEVKNEVDDMNDTGDRQPISSFHHN